MQRISLPLLLLGLVITPCTLSVAGMTGAIGLGALFSEPAPAHYEGRGLHPTELVMPPDRATVVRGGVAMIAIGTFFLLLACVGLDLVWRGTTPEAREAKLGQGRIGVLRARLYGAVGLTVALLSAVSGVGGFATGGLSTAYGIASVLPLVLGSLVLLKLRSARLERR